MQKHNNIKALFFLGIFSMLLLHQMLPHWHHKHDVDHTDKAVTHNDTHGHHHDVPQKENTKKGFLDLFLEMHVHTVVSNEILLTHKSSTKHIEVKKDISTSISVVQYHSSINYDRTEQIEVYRPPNKHFNPYLASLDTRGPPTLG
jgi:zinc transporter ZupT